MNLEIKVVDNGDVEPVSLRWQRVSPEGCAAHVIVSRDDCTTVVIMCQRLEDGEPWVGYVIKPGERGHPVELAGGVISTEEGAYEYVGLNTQLTGI